MKWPKPFIPALEEEDTELFSQEEWAEILKNMGEMPLSYPTWSAKDYRCTCGAEATYGINTGHSSWCDKLRV